jgi:hypothetical protein
MRYLITTRATVHAWRTGAVIDGVELACLAFELCGALTLEIGTTWQAHTTFSTWILSTQQLSGIKVAH